MSAITNEVALQLTHAVREQTSLLRQQIMLARLQQPQWWGMPELRAHYPALSEDQIVAHLIHHCGYQGQTGVRLKVHLDQVLKLDAVFDGRLAAS